MRPTCIAVLLIPKCREVDGDGISHAVLPGIVVAFLVTGTVAAWPMMIGAAAAAILSVLPIEAIKRIGGVEPGAAMGVVFTTLFAAGVVLLEQSDTSSVHLDVEHALYGNLESLIWFAAEGWGSLLDPEALAELPPQVGRLAVVLVVVAVFMVGFWKELAISTFDPDFAGTVGIRTGAVGFALVVVVAIDTHLAKEAPSAVSKSLSRRRPGAKRRGSVPATRPSRRRLRRLLRTRSGQAGGSEREQRRPENGAGGARGR